MSSTLVTVSTAFAMLPSPRRGHPFLHHRVQLGRGDEIVDLAKTNLFR